MKYIQSFYQYPVTFSSIGKTIPARLAQGDMRNIAEVTEKELEKLQNCEPRFRELVNQKKYRVLNHIPASYVPAAEQINQAHAEAERLRKENEALKARLEEEDVRETVKEHESVAEVEDEVIEEDETAEEEIEEEKPRNKRK